MRSSQTWRQYLQEFHQNRAGITEEILSRAVYKDKDPYEWLVEAFTEVGLMLDLGCGSAPTWNSNVRCNWVGFDRSQSELECAKARGAMLLALGDVTALPFQDSAFRGFLCSMALMLFDPLDKAVSEIARVVETGSTGAILLPGVFPLTVSDMFFYARAKVSLGVSSFASPSKQRTSKIKESLRANGFEVVSKENRRFSFRIKDQSDIRRFGESWYLPGVSAKRFDRSIEALRGQIGRDIGIPLQRWIVRKVAD